MTDPYIHGTSNDEQDRLELMNGLLNERELAIIRPVGDEVVLEMGAGTGVFTRDLATRLPHGRIVAIEKDPRQLARARAVCAGRANVDLREGDAYDPPLTEAELGSFDIVHARFLLEHLRDPARAVAAMVRAARPGGRIMLVDDDHAVMRLWPEPPHFEELWSDYIRRYDALGMDPFVGRRLVALLHEAGATQTTTTELFYGASSNEPSFASFLENLAAVIEGSHPPDAPPELAAWVAGLRTWGQGEGRAIWYGLPVAIATRD